MFISIDPSVTLCNNYLFFSNPGSIENSRLRIQQWWNNEEYRLIQIDPPIENLNNINKTYTLPSPLSIVYMYIVTTGISL